MVSVNVIDSVSVSMNATDIVDGIVIVICIVIGDCCLMFDV